MVSNSRRGPWSQPEDDLLRVLVKDHGASNWVKIASLIQSRNPKQCRERWHQNLKPGLNLNPISSDEGKLIAKLVHERGPRWADIARELGNRSDNAVKNWWNGGANRRKRRENVRVETARDQRQVPSMPPQQYHLQPQYQLQPQFPSPSQYPLQPSYPTQPQFPQQSQYHAQMQYASHQLQHQEQTQFSHNPHHAVVVSPQAALFAHHQIPTDPSHPAALPPQQAFLYQAPAQTPQFAQNQATGVYDQHYETTPNGFGQAHGSRPYLPTQGWDVSMEKGYLQPRDLPDPTPIKSSYSGFETLGQGLSSVGSKGKEVMRVDSVLSTDNRPQVRVA